MDRKIKNFSLLILLGGLISVFIGIRFIDIGKDTEQYLLYFEKYSNTLQISDNLEFGFSIFLIIINNLVPNVNFFFFCVAFLITTLYLLLFKKLYLKIFYQEQYAFYKALIFFSLLLLSSWYLTMTTNGLRQGISLVILYHSVYEFYYNNDIKKFFVYFILACSFHYSAFLIAPFLVFKYLKNNHLFFLWILTALGYFFGINELVVKIISQNYNLPVYEYIKYYSLARGEKDGGLYNGFIISFFLYTIFWPVFLIILGKIRVNNKYSSNFNDNMRKLINIYLILSLPYFVFGFGPFSNRYAMICWFLVPMMQFCILNLFKFNHLIYRLSVIIFVFVFLYFNFIYLDWLRIFG